VPEATNALVSVLPLVEVPTKITSLPACAASEKVESTAHAVQRERYVDMDVRMAAARRRPTAPPMRQRAAA
jgi:hypothetical protein